MRAYMAYHRGYGPQEGAILVVAHNSKEAKKLAWGLCLNVDEWTDQAIKWLRDESVLLLADQTKLEASEPHVIENPAHCQACHHWGEGLTSDGLCCNCNQYPGDELIARLLPKVEVENK